MYGSSSVSLQCVWRAAGGHSDSYRGTCRDSGINSDRDREKKAQTKANEKRRETIWKEGGREGRGR